MQIQLKPCSPDQLTILQQLSIQTFTQTFGRQNKPANLAAYLENAYQLEQLAKELNNPFSWFFIAYVDHVPAGYLKINTDDAQSESMGPQFLEIERIYVAKGFQKHGIGKVMYQKALQYAQQLNKTKIWLGVWEFNDNARQFYHHTGFRQIGSHDFYMGDEKQTDLMMAKNI